MLRDSSKYGYDHVKGTFDALTIFNDAFKKALLAKRKNCFEA